LSIDIILLAIKGRYLAIIGIIDSWYNTIRALLCYKDEYSGPKRGGGIVSYQLKKRLPAWDRHVNFLDFKFLEMY